MHTTFDIQLVRENLQDEAHTDIKKITSELLDVEHKAGCDIWITIKHCSISKNTRSDAD